MGKVKKHQNTKCPICGEDATTISGQSPPPPITTQVNGITIQKYWITSRYKCECGSIFEIRNKEVNGVPVPFQFGYRIRKIGEIK